MRELERRQRHRERLADARAVVVPVQDAAARKLGIGERLAQLSHARGRNVARLEIGLPFVGAFLLHLRGDFRGLLVVARRALAEAGAFRLGRIPDRLVEAPMLARVRRGELHHAVAGRIGRRGRKAHPVAGALRMVARMQEVGDVRGLQDHGDVEHREIDVLSLAGARAVEERRRDGKCACRSGRIVDDRRAGLDGAARLGPGGCRDSRARLDGVIVGRLRAARPALAERAHRRINQSRVEP